MISPRKLLAASVVLFAAVGLQGCKKKAAPPAAPSEPYPTHPTNPTHPVGRVAVDGYPCEHTWSARWRDGSRSRCHTFCCYHRNRKTHRRSRRSYCRVHEHGHEVLRACARRGALPPISFAEVVAEGEEEPLELSAPEADADAETVEMVEEEEEENDEPEAEEGGMASLVQRLGALPVFACSAGFVLGGVTVFLVLRPRLRGGLGSEDQKVPFIES